jgi:hypothetical protein
VGSIDFHRAYAWIIILGFIGAVASPVHRSIKRVSGSDGYPLSWYPMFSGKRTNTLKAYYMVGLGADGRRYKIPYTYWARGGFNQGRSQLRSAVRGGKQARLAKCEKVAARLAKRKHGWRSRVQSVVVAKGHFDVETYFVEHERLPRAEYIMAKCPVIRSTPDEKSP